MATWRARGIALGVLSLAVVLGAVTWYGRRARRTSETAAPPAQPPTSAAAPPTPTPAAEAVHGQMELVSRILEQGLTPERAKLLFSMVVGPLPGVTVPAGSREPTDFDGTLAVSYIEQEWAALSHDQRGAAAELIHPTHGAPATGRSSALFSRPRIIPAAYRPPADTAADVPAWDYQGMATKANGTLAALLQVPTVPFTVSVDFKPPTGTEYAHAWSWFKSNVYGEDGPDIPYPSGCELIVHDQKFVGMSGMDAEAIITHEMTHCFQQRVAQTATNLMSIHPWITEGEATWAMFVVRPDAGDYLLGGIWKPYASKPDKLYTDRSYDAVGIYGHLSDLVGDAPVWGKLLPLIQLGINGKDTDAFTALIEGHHLDYFNSWGASYFGTSGQKSWEMQGPGAQSKTGPAPQEKTVDVNTSESLTPAGPYLGEQFLLNGSPDILTVSLMTGYGRLHDQNFSVDTDLDSSAPLELCLKQGGCKCPDGSDGASMFTKPATSPLSIGINGGDTTATVGIAGRSLDRFCKQPDPDVPPGGGGGGGGGGGSGGDNTQQPTPPPPPPDGESWGDTHVATFDGLGYDFQVVGEYTLARSTKDDFVVETRQVPALGPRMASVNQAVATRIGGQRVTFTMEDGATVLRVDGHVVTGPPPALKAGSLTRADTAYGGAYRLTWPDGTVLRVQQLGSYAIDVKVHPAPSRRGTLVGLLGDFDGSRDNDLVGANDARLTTSPEDVNQKLASAWAVTPATSLFDYAPGQSTSTFVDHDFPAKDADAARLSNYGMAEQACRAHGITDPQLLHNCIFDLAVTNNFVFGSRYAHAQQVLAARAAIARPIAGAIPTRQFWVTGEILDATSEPEYTFQADKDDVIWVGNDPACQDAVKLGYSAFLWLMDPSGKRIASQSGCDMGRVELPATGTYTFRAVFKYKGEITRYRIPVRFMRHDRRQQVTYGEMVSGNIEQRAAWDLYSFTGQEGDYIVVSGPGCDLGQMGTFIYDSDGHDYLGPGCRAGTAYKLPKTGTYQLVVNGLNSVQPGPYHFVFQGGKLAPK